MCWLSHGMVGSQSFAFGALKYNHGFCKTSFLNSHHIFKTINEVTECQGCLWYLCFWKQVSTYSPELLVCAVEVVKDSEDAVALVELQMMEIMRLLIFDMDQELVVFRTEWEIMPQEMGRKADGSQSVSWEWRAGQCWGNMCEMNIKNRKMLSIILC